jgi:aspartyl protease family protein
MTDPRNDPARTAADSASVPAAGARRPARAGFGMLALAWVAVFAAVFLWFQDWTADQVNPNRAAALPASGNEVTLQRNRGGHYVADGAINGTAVTFMLDTGATQVALSLAAAKALGLALGEPVRLRTANGETGGFRTRLDRVRLGPIELADVAAVASAGIDDDMILLGMSFLKRVEFAQRGEQLTLRAVAAPGAAR